MVFTVSTFQHKNDNSEFLLLVVVLVLAVLLLVVGVVVVCNSNFSCLLMSVPLSGNCRVQCGLISLDLTNAKRMVKAIVRDC